MLVERLAHAEVILALCGTTREEQSSMAERSPRVLKEVELLVEAQLRALIVVYELDAANNFVVVLLYKLLRANIGHTVQSDVANASQVLHKVLPEAMHETICILGLSELLHVL